jgi:hypothetical protein
MPPTTEPRQRGGEPERSTLASRLVWFAALWLAGLGTTALLAYGLRALLFM